MGNITTYIDGQSPVRYPLATVVSKFEKYIDFSAATLASGNSADVLKLPKGTVVLVAGWITHLTDAQNPTFALSLPGMSATLKSATAVGATGAGISEHLATPTLITTDDVLRVTVGTADANDCKVTFFAVVMLNEQGSPS